MQRYCLWIFSVGPVMDLGLKLDMMMACGLEYVDCSMRQTVNVKRKEQRQRERKGYLKRSRHVYANFTSQPNGSAPQVTPCGHSESLLSLLINTQILHRDMNPRYPPPFTRNRPRWSQTPPNMPHHNPNMAIITPQTPRPHQLSIVGRLHTFPHVSGQICGELN